MGGGEINGPAEGDPGSRSDPRSIPDNYQDVTGNFQKDLLESYLTNVSPSTAALRAGTGPSSDSLRSARSFKPTGQVFDAKGNDITDMYNSYLSWQQSQRVTNSDHEQYSNAFNAASGRSSTILGGGSTTKGALG